MKKLFILAPFMVVTSMIYSADNITISVPTIYYINGLSKIGTTLRYTVNVHNETLKSLADKIESAPAPQTVPAENVFTVHYFTFWAHDERGCITPPRFYRPHVSNFGSTTLSDIGVREDEAVISAGLEEEPGYYIKGD